MLGILSRFRVSAVASTDCFWILWKSRSSIYYLQSPISSRRLYSTFQAFEMYMWLEGGMSIVGRQAMQMNMKPLISGWSWRGWSYVASFGAFSKILRLAQVCSKFHTTTASSYHGLSLVIEIYSPCGTGRVIAPFGSACCLQLSESMPII